MKTRLAYALYAFFVWLIQPLVRCKLALRAKKEPLYGEAMAERFGVYADHWVGVSADASRPLIWVHAVSLGEVRAAAILLKELRLALPQMRLLLTNGTATGRAQGAQLLQADDVQVWQPWDTLEASRRFLMHFKPALGVLLETEVWPNLVTTAPKLGVPMVLVNARMSDKSLRKSMRWQTLATAAYQSFTQIHAQTDADAQRLAHLGAVVTATSGNLKFDVTPDSAQIARAQRLRSQLRKPVVMLASSREGEEQMWLEALQQALAASHAAHHPQLVQWLIVPRHPQRFDEVAQLIVSAGHKLTRRGAWEEGSIWLGDSVGEMSFYGSLASVAILGGSFEKLGGQNLIELLACGCTVVMGEHTFNFAQSAHMAQQAGVAKRVHTMQEAVGVSLQSCFDSAQTTVEASRAKAFVALHQGAAHKTATALAALLAQQRV